MVSVTNFNLDLFLKDYKPKSLEKFMSPYINHKRLKEYILMDDNNKRNLRSTKTYIKYINIDDAEKLIPKSNYIKRGGILLGCGKFIGNKFIKSEDMNQWKYLMIKSDPSPLENDDGTANEERKSRIFFLKISKHYIFYKRFDNSLRDILRRRLEEMDLELKDNQGNIVV